MLDATESADERIEQAPLALHYSLKLPQSIYKLATKEVEEIFGLPNKAAKKKIICKSGTRNTKETGVRTRRNRRREEHRHRRVRH